MQYNFSIMELQTKNKRRQTDHNIKVFYKDFASHVDNVPDKKQTPCQRPPFNIEMKDKENQTTIECISGTYEILWER